ncbi:hypothetical protein Q1695_002383 [Nippostrongylus brasiliensis]|nr:hypothetical protein Q1695_002383 [Nippostrongylus brasiliensis]
MNTINLPYNSNDAHIWTTKDPDLELVEPRILVSINRNYMVFGRKLGRPPQNHQVTLVNHGETPVAFKVLTTDNYAYFVNQVYGIIPGRHLHALPHLRAPNQFILQVNRRPYNCFCDEQQPSHWNTPQKDKLFILLAPILSFSIPPAAVFHHEAPHEKLRICLEYTGMPVDPAKDVSLIFKKFSGWCTWKVEKKKEGAYELLGKNREEAKKMITNKPCKIPLTFEEIPEAVPVDISKKKKPSKVEKKGKKDKDKEEKHKLEETQKIDRTPSERHVSKFVGKLAAVTHPEGYKERGQRSKIYAQLSAETSKLLQRTDLREVGGSEPDRSTSTKFQTQKDSVDSLTRRPSDIALPKIIDIKSIFAMKSKQTKKPTKKEALTKSKESRESRASHTKKSTV